MTLEKHILPGIYIMFGLLSVLVLIDFFWPGQQVSEVITYKSREIASKKNGFRDYYYVSDLSTENYVVRTTNELAETAEVGDPLVIEISPIFKEINEVDLPKAEASELYSHRIFSGLILPILVLMILEISYKKKYGYSTLVFVILVVFLVNFIYLLN